MEATKSDILLGRSPPILNKMRATAQEAGSSSLPCCSSPSSELGTIPRDFHQYSGLGVTWNFSMIPSFPHTGTRSAGVTDLNPPSLPVAGGQVLSHPASSLQSTAHQAWASREGSGSTCPGGVWKLILYCPLQPAAVCVCEHLHVMKAKRPHQLSFSLLSASGVLFVNMHMGVSPACMSVYHTSAWCLWRAEEGTGSPGACITMNHLLRLLYIMFGDGVSY